MRGAPHNGFAAAILPTSVRTATAVLGRPGRVRVERHVHWTTEPLAVPPHHGVELHDDQGGAPLSPGLGEQDPEDPICWAELWALDRARQRGYLLTKHEIFQRNCLMSAADHSDRSEEHHQPG